MSSDRRRRHRAALRGHLSDGVSRNRTRPRLEGLEDRVVLSSNALAGEITLSGPQAGDPLQVVRGFLAEQGASWGLGGADLDRMVVTDRYTSSPSGVTYIYLRQGFNGLQVAGSEVNVAVDREGRILTVGGRFSPVIGAMAEQGVPAPSLSASQALDRTINALGLERSGEIILLRSDTTADKQGSLTAPGAARGEVPARLHYVMAADGSPRLAWNFALDVPSGEHWYDASVDANTGELLRVDDWVSNYTYNVFALPFTSPIEGARTRVVDPHLLAPNASPAAWHTTNAQTPGPEFTDTRGNNVFAQEDTNADDQGGNRADGGANLLFDFPFDDTQAPASSQNAAITQVFYVTNVVHDVLYQYGFTEAAGNFQQNNFARGGLGNDAIQADVQDSSGTNNANFATPPDGTPGRMQMFEFTLTNPRRDGAFVNQIIVHEIGHGVSNRLTGGPANAGALQAFQSRSMGEGWSDFFALMFTQDAGDRKTDSYPQGVYVGLPNGIRRQPYSFDTSIFSLSYKDLGVGSGANSVHANGEIWAATLWDLNWLLVDRQGFDPDLYKGVDLDDPSASSGNQIALQLVLEGMKLQPVTPTYLQARDAILRADQALFGGRYAPEIWAAFARRGMGFSAVDNGDPTNFRGIREARDVPVFIDVAFNTADFAGLAENSPLNDFVLGTMTDRSGLRAVSEYSATVNWGDGSPAEPVTLRPNAAGGLDILGSHTYREGGTFRVTISADRNGSLPQVATVDVPIFSWPLSAETGNALASREGDRVLDVRVGSFVDFDPEQNPLSHYSVTIDWGDGVQSPGRLVRRADGGFDVFGTHTYREGGKLTYRLNVAEAGGQTISVPGQANVESFPVSAAGGFAYAVQEGISFNGQVARFVDQSPIAKGAQSYRVVIDWGDGTTGTGTLVPDGVGAFLVLGDHAFTLPTDGRTDLTIRVTVTEGGGNSATATSAASVTDAPIAAEGRRVATIEGPFRGVIARFEDFNALGTAGEFSARVDWGDGVMTEGVIEPDPEGGFRVVGTRPDLRTGSFPVRVDVQSRGGSSSSATSTLEVSDAPIVARGLPVTIAAGPFRGVVASFTDANPAGQADDFAATIAWGDGSSSTGQVVRQDDGTFQVVGDHAYAPGSFPVGVTITSRGSGLRYDVRSRATVNGAPLSARSIPVQGVELANATYWLGAVFNGNPLGTADDLEVMIDWGDGTVSPGEVVVHPNGPGSGFLVSGQHRYGRSGGFPISATITGPGGSEAMLSTSVGVDVVTVPVQGGLAGGSRLSGFAVPGSTVILFARPTGGDPFLLGEVPASPDDGGWSFSAPTLADGVYTLIAASKNRSGIQNSPLVTLGGGDLVVDRNGPNVRDVFLDARRRQLLVTLGDSLSGLATGTVLNPANYAVTDARGRALRVAGVELGPAGADGSQVVIVRLGGGGRDGLSRGGYTVSINGAGITDRAGNALTEAIFTPFPRFSTGPSTAFVAQLGTDGSRSTPPMRVVPADQLRGANAFRRFINAGFRSRPSFLS